MVNARRSHIAIAAVSVTALVGALASPATAAGTRQFAYRGYEIDWHAGEGLADSRGGKNYALHMGKTDPNASDEDHRGAGAIVTGVAGEVLTELGFDIAGLSCGDDPYYRVKAASGEIHWLRCSDIGVTMTPLAEGDWIRVRFPVASLGIVIDDVRLLYDPPGGPSAVHVDNLTVNAHVVGKPGSN